MLFSHGLVYLGRIGRGNRWQEAIADVSERGRWDVEKFDWIMEHWQQIGLVVSVIALAITGKWALVKAKIAQILVQSGEGEGLKGFREKVERATASAPPIVREALANMAARTDPDPNKKPESKARRFFKFLGRSAIGIILKR